MLQRSIITFVFRSRISRALSTSQSYFSIIASILSYRSILFIPFIIQSVFYANLVSLNSFSQRLNLNLGDPVTDLLNIKIDQIISKSLQTLGSLLLNSAISLLDPLTIKLFMFVSFPFRYLISATSKLHSCTNSKNL